MGTEGAVHTRGAQRWRAVGVPLTVNLLLPLVLYYVLRALDVAQWQALLLSGVIPAAHAVGTALVRRRVEVFDLLVVVLLGASAGLSAVSGSPRVLLLKDAGIPVVLGLWVLGTLFAARPLAFHFGQRLRGPAGAEAAERAWRELPEFRTALRGLTLLWGGAQLLDAALSTVAALGLPIDLVPVVGKIESFTILGAMVALTVRRSRAFRDRYGIPLFGLAAAGAPRPSGDAPKLTVSDALRS
ncbi:VC0807 family protein [Streptomyces sp. NPDC039016]|uniref:VC0807 family protein n=1 Tax=unclassified Streptomyces TaxID=2593676 RepID=UPI0015E0C5EB|nr:VC0807 family protein [Streptomyces sp. CB02959]